MPKPPLLEELLDQVVADAERRGIRFSRDELEMLAAMRRIVRQEGDRIMANLEGIDSALTELSTQITQVADQLSGLQAGSVTQEQLDAVEARVRDAAAKVDALVEDEGETTS